MDFKLTESNDCLINSLTAVVKVPICCLKPRTVSSVAAIIAEVTIRLIVTGLTKITAKRFTLTINSMGSTNLHLKFAPILNYYTFKFVYPEPVLLAFVPNLSSPIHRSDSVTISSSRPQLYFRGRAQN